MLCGYRHVVLACVEAFLGLGGRYVADRGQQSSVVEPVDPVERCELDGFECAPRSSPVDDLGLVEADHGLGEGVVIAVADAADGGLQAGLEQPLGVFDRYPVSGRIPAKMEIRAARSL